MRKWTKRLGISLFIAALAVCTAAGPAAGMNTVQASAATVKTEKTTTAETTKTQKTAKKEKIVGIVNTSFLHIRNKKTTHTKCIKLVHRGDKIKVLSTGTKWVQVKVNGKIGYTQGKYLDTEYGTASSPYANAIKGTVTSKNLKVMSRKNGNGKLLGKIKNGKKVKVLSTGTKWVKILYNDEVAYAKGKKISVGKDKTAADEQEVEVTTGMGDQVIAYALQFVGNPYVWGGTSLTHGADCSGFIMSVYKHFGKSLPHSSYSMRSCGTAVNGLSNAKPGDIICYDGHVALYMGNNKIVHASNSKPYPEGGIKVSTNASYRHIITIRRIV